MNTPVSQPVTPPQPDIEVYGFQNLALFTTYTRDSYRAAFGIEAPPWDPTRPRKWWFDTTVDTTQPTNVAVYKVAGQNATNNWAILQMVIPALDAATVNLPGAIVYPPYVVAPSDATRGGVPFNPMYLSLRSDADALMAEFNADSIVDEGISPVFPAVFPADEPRRLWDIVYRGVPLNVGDLLAQKNAKGVGSPGHWDTSSGEPVWIADPPAPTGLDDTRPPRPMPVRDMLPNETLAVGLMGVSIVRTDLQQQSNQASGQFTPDDRATLAKIYQIVSKLG